MGNTKWCPLSQAGCYEEGCAFYLHNKCSVKRIADSLDELVRVMKDINRNIRGK